MGCVLNGEQCVYFENLQWKFRKQNMFKKQYIYIIHIDFYTMLKNHLLYNNFKMRNRRNRRKLIKEKIHLNLI